MENFTHLRPVAPVARETGRPAGDDRSRCRLADGWLEFSIVELARRRGEPVRRVVPVADVVATGGGRGLDAPEAERLRALLQLATRPRPAVAGLALDRPRLMGIVNVTPDSFSDGGRLGTIAAAVDHAVQLVADGADILDVGGESTRPGSEPVPVKLELERVIPVVEAIRRRVATPISVDTRKAEVMRCAATAGASMINDVSALTFDPAAMTVAAGTGLPIVLMHAQGDPKTMQVAPRYDDVVLDVFDWLEARIAACVAAGIDAGRLIADPGIGFGKTFEHNLALMRGLATFHALGVPVLLGASRKSFIGRITGESAAAERVAGSIAAALAGIAQGSQILRVHDVAATRRAVDVWMATTATA